MLKRIPTTKLLAWTAVPLLIALTLTKLVPWQATAKDYPSNTSITSITSGDICIVAPATPFDPNWGISLLAPRKIPQDARCPVCGMYPARTNTWAAQVIFKNGDTHFFDSPLTLFIYLLDPAKYSRGRDASEIAISYVTDTTQGQWIKTSEAFFVSESDAMGPMRAGNFVAFARQEDAQRFTEKHGGTVLNANQIQPQSLQNLHRSRQHLHLTNINAEKT